MADSTQAATNPDQWAAVDRYFGEMLVQSDSALEAALHSSTAAGLPAISVSPAQGKLLHLLARIQNASTILEVGTLGGYSTIWLARAMPPGGRLITIEFDPRHADVARANFRHAKVDQLVDLRLGRAIDVLPQIAAEGRGPFDLVFIDADKAGTAEYFSWALKLSRRGTLIIVDNVVRKGALIDAASQDPNVQGMRRFNEAVAAEPRVSATGIQTVGLKGYDGFALVLVTAE